MEVCLHKLYSGVEITLYIKNQHPGYTVVEKQLIEKEEEKRRKEKKKKEEERQRRRVIGYLYIQSLPLWNFVVGGDFLRGNELEALNKYSKSQYFLAKSIKYTNL